MSDLLKEEKPEMEEELEEESLPESGQRLSSLRERPYRFVRSFKARLIQTSDETRYYYSELKNELLTYKNIHDRLSWNHELFNTGRNHVVRMQIRGKTLVLYLALEPNEVEGMRFSLEPSSESLKNQKTPSILRINSPARCEFAKELFALIMAKFGAEKKKDPLPPKMDYADIPYETTESLLNQDMIHLEMRVGATPKIIYLKNLDEDETPSENEEGEENENGEEEKSGFSFVPKTYSFERSFTSRLIQSEDQVKFYYSELKNAALAYKAVKSRRSWNHETFTYGRPVLMRLQIRGKTLCVFLPLAPETETGTRYHLEKAPAVKKNEKTPSMVRITSQGKCSFVLSLIPKILEEAGKDKKLKNFEAEDYASMPYETTETLLNKGIIRLVIRKDELPDAGGPALDEDAEDEALIGAGEEDQEVEEKHEEEEPTEIREDEPEIPEFPAEEERQYDHVRVVTRERKDRINYEELLRQLQNGEGIFEYRKRYLLRAIDENWVTAIEECLPVIDKLIRNPTHTIEENEEILPIERSRKITQRSVVHLSQHVNMVSKVENGYVTPNKILNVFYDDTIKTYENKFLNTLLMRLFVFVNRRYEIAKKEASDEVRTSITFEEAFHDELTETRGKIHMYMELSEKPKDILIFKNYTYTTDLWKRVERLNHICFTNLNSDFVRQMGKTYVRPPIMRTNAIMKNKDFHQCLLLWQYIEGYENVGYELMIQDELKRPGEAYVNEFCKNMTDQYLTFVHAVRAGKNQEETLDTFLAENPIVPKIKDELDEVTREEFDIGLPVPRGYRPLPNASRYRARRLSAYEKTVAEAIEVALEADRILKSASIEDELAKLDAEIGTSMAEFESETVDEEEKEPVTENVDGE